jgi:Putative Ig domain
VATVWLAANASGASAGFFESFPTPGNHLIKANYAGDVTYSGSCDTTNQTVTNAPPVVVNPSGQSNVVGDSVFLPISASDVDGDVLTYSAVGLPAGLSIDPDSGIISGRVAVGADSTSPLNATVTVYDGANSVSQTFAWTVAHFSIPSPGDQFNAVGDSVYVLTGGSDADGDPLTFSASSLPPGLSIDPDGGLITGTITNTANDGVPYAVTLTAFDGAHTASQTFHWTVTHVFVVNPGDQQNADGDNVILPINAGENNGTPVTVTAVGLPPGLSINAAHNIVGVISNNADTNSPYNVTVTATDGTYSDSQTFHWTVSRLTLSNPGDQTNYDGQVVSLPLSAADNLGDVLTYSATGLPTGLSIDGGTGVISGTVAPTADANGPYAVTVTVTGGGASASQTFTWTVNNPVSVSPLFDQTDALGGVVSVAVAATTTTGDTLTYSATGLPPGVTINSSTGLISGTITNLASITTPYDVTVTVNDGAISANAYFVWTVSHLTLTNPGDKTNASGDTVSLALTASDNLGDTLNYTATGLPPGLSINATTGVISGVIALTADAGGPYTTTVSVTGGGATTSQTFVWNVAHLLVVDPGDQNSADNDVVSLQIHVTDNNSGALTYSATGLPPGLSINTTGLISGTIASNADINSPYVVMVTATDANGHSASDTFFWSVTQLMLTNPGTQLNADGDTVTLALMANGPSGVALIYTAGSLPPGLSINTATGVISGLLSMTADAAGPFYVTVTAADGHGAYASQTFTWNIDQLILENPGDQAYAENQSVTLPIIVDDNVAGALTFIVTGLPAGLSLIGNSIVGTVPASDVSATPYNIAVSVIDALGRTASVNFAIRVLSYTVTFINTTMVSGTQTLTTGFLKDPNGPQPLPHPVFLVGTISDPTRLPNIQFSVTGQADRIQLGEVHKVVAFGLLPIFEVDVRGLIQTPVSKPMGDTIINVVDTGIVKASANVIVVVPAAIRGTQATPLPTANQIVKGQALAINDDTSPTHFDVPAPNVFLGTGYLVFLKELLSNLVDGQLL